LLVTQSWGREESTFVYTSRNLVTSLLSAASAEIVLDICI
jgi:hypothetical protein